MAQLHIAYPNIHVHLWSGDDELVKGRLKKGLLDFGLLFRPLEPVLISRNYLIWHKEQRFSRAARLVKEAFIEAFDK